MKIHFLILCLFFFYSCSNISSVSVNSVPTGAKISAIDEAGNVEDIGVTPNVYPLEKFFKGGEQFKEIIVSKDRHISERVLVPRPKYSTKYKFSWKLLKLEQFEEKFLLKDQEKLAGAIASAYGSISRKDYLRAESILNQALNDFSGVSVLYDLMGNLQYLKKDYKKAYAFYKKSASYNPNNSETQKMIEKLKGMYE